MTDVFFLQIDDVIQKSIDGEQLFDEHEVASDELGDDAIVTFGDTYRVLDKGLIFVEGTYFARDEETGELAPDFSLTLIYDDIADEEFDYNNYLYFEQDGPEVSIHNFLKAREGRRINNEKKNADYGSTYADALCV